MTENVENFWETNQIDMQKLFDSEPKPFSEYVTENQDYIYLQMRKDKGAYYPIEKDKCESYSSILSLTLHLNHKGWVTKEMLSEFIIKATKHAGISPYLIG